MLKCDFCDRPRVLGLVFWHAWPICKGCAQNYPNSESWRRLKYQPKRQVTWRRRISKWFSQPWGTARWSA